MSYDTLQSYNLSIGHWSLVSKTFNRISTDVIFNHCVVCVRTEDDTDFQSQIELVTLLNGGKLVWCMSSLIKNALLRDLTVWPSTWTIKISTYKAVLCEFFQHTSFFKLIHFSNLSNHVLYSASSLVWSFWKTVWYLFPNVSIWV